jgi:hypothetical protein
MDYKKLSLGLGVFSIALGAAELLASRRIARTLDAEEGDGIVRLFGGREIAAGASILASPAASVTIWNRVVGDAMDLAALGLAARKSPANKAVWGAIGFVVGATLIDILTARGLDRETGKTFPTDPNEAAETPPALQRPTSIEPAVTARALAPAIA